MGKIFYTGKNYDILFYINIYIYIYILKIKANMYVY